MSYGPVGCGVTQHGYDVGINAFRLSQPGHYHVLVGAHEHIESSPLAKGRHIEGRVSRKLARVIGASANAFAGLDQIRTDLVKSLRPLSAVLQPLSTSGADENSVVLVVEHLVHIDARRQAPPGQPLPNLCMVCNHV